MTQMKIYIFFIGIVFDNMVFNFYDLKYFPVKDKNNVIFSTTLRYK